MKRKIRRSEIAVVFGEPSLPLLGVGSRTDSVRWEEVERGEVEMTVDQDYATQQQQPQQPHMDPSGTFPLSDMGMGTVGPSQLETTEKDGDDDDDERGRLTLAPVQAADGIPCIFRPLRIIQIGKHRVVSLTTHWHTHNRRSGNQHNR